MRKVDTAHEQLVLRLYYLAERTVGAAQAVHQEVQRVLDIDFLGDAVALREAAELLSSRAVYDFAVERRRQVAEEGWTPDHDDEHRAGELALGAAAYAAYSSSLTDGTRSVGELALKLWPWQWSWWKPTTLRRNLVKAGALLIAEVERLDRKAQR